MRKFLVIFVFFIAIAFSNCGNGQNSGELNTDISSISAGTAVLTFKEYEHNFGKVTEGEKVAYSFAFENKGVGDLIVSSASTTCGCTVPRYDTRPIAPGTGGNLEVVFDTEGRNGMQTKTISVKSNASVPVIILKITAEVETKSNN